MMLLDADALTYLISAPDRSASFFWAGLHSGDRFGFVTAGPSGYSASGLDSALVPQHSASG